MGSVHIERWALLAHRPNRLRAPLREFEKRKEAEVAREAIPAGERAFLRRYFELLERAVKGSKGKKGKARK